MDLPRPARGSWWLEEALAHDPGEPCPPLERDAEADVVIVGGGFTGMWTAYFLKEREPDLDVVLLERTVCGGGPSGRNGGFLNALWEDVEFLAEKLGDDEAVRTCTVAERSIEQIGAWCELNDVDAWYRRDGHLGVATASAQAGAWSSWIETARRLGVADGRIKELSAADVQAYCASPVFREGVITPQGATVQPARLARGLRRVVLERGVRIFERSPVVRFGFSSPVLVETPGGSVRAGQAVLGVNAWAAQWRAFKREILPRGTYIVLTEPIPEELEALGWTSDVGIYDFRTALHYLRTTPDGRLAFGSASSRAGIGTGLGPRLDYDEPSIRRVMHDLDRMFPSLRGVRFDSAWGGPMDVSGLHVPFFGSLGSSRSVHYGLGFTGGGNGPCHLAGQILSGLVLRIEDEYTNLPLVGLRPRPFPPEPFLSLGAFLTHEAIIRKDEAEDRGESPNRAVGFVAGLPRKLGYNIGP